MGAANKKGLRLVPPALSNFSLRKALMSQRLAPPQIAHQRGAETAEQNQSGTTTSYLASYPRCQYCCHNSSNSTTATCVST